MQSHPSSGGAPGIPLPRTGTRTAFLSSVKQTHWSIIQLSFSLSLADLSKNEQATKFRHHYISLAVLSDKKYSIAIFITKDEKQRTTIPWSSFPETKLDMVSRAFCGITIGLPVAKPNKVLSRLYVTNQEGVARPVPSALGRLLDFWGKGDSHFR